MLLRPSARQAVKLATIGVLLFCLSMLVPKRAEAYTATPIQCTPTLEVVTFPLVVQEDFTRNFREMTAMTPTNGISQFSGGGLGNTVAKINASSNVTVDTAGCPKVTITVGFVDVTIFVAKELQASACAQQHVLRHEREHVSIYSRALRSLASRAFARLAPKVAKLKSESLSAEQRNDLLGAAIDEAGTVMRDHNEFDSSEEYDRNLTACDGVIPQLYRTATRRSR